MKRTRCLFGKFASVAAIVVFVSVANTSFARAEDPSTEQIIEALKPKIPLTRRFTIPSIDRTRANEEQHFIKGLQSKEITRSLTLTERDRIATISKDKPKIDLEINFDFDSDQLTMKGVDLASRLGLALKSSDMKGATALIAGHTDAKGSAEYNQNLSERRAATVKRFLIEKYGIQAETLLAAGYGKERLKNSSSPYSGENRRVEIVNLGGPTAAR